MGRRKAKRKAVTKKREVLDTVFDCLFCNHEKSIQIRLDFHQLIGHLHCKICGITFRSPINSLSEHIDVYSDWIDACEKSNKESANEKKSSRNLQSNTDSLFYDPEENDNDI